MLRLGVAAVVALFLTACGPKTMQTRLRDSERRAGEIEQSLGIAERALEKPDPDEAKRQLDRAEKLLADPDATLYPEYDLLKSRAQEDRAALPIAREALEKKKHDEVVTRVRAKVASVSERAKQAFDDATSTKVTAEAIRTAKAAFEELHSSLMDGASLETKDPAYGAYATERRAWLEVSEPQVKAATAKLDFIAGPLQAANEGSEKLRAAKKAKSASERKELLSAAIAKLKECSAQGKALVAKTPALASSAVNADGAVASVEGVLSDCSSGVKTAEKALKKLKK